MNTKISIELEQKLKAKKIAVLYGGNSAEREVSLNSGSYIFNALKERGFDVQALDTKEYDLVNLKADGFDLVFNILHGKCGEDGALQGFLQTMGISYTGCGILASALTMDKMRTKLLWKALGMPVADAVFLHKKDMDKIDYNSIVADLDFPMMVKPSLEGSSFGMSKAKDLAGLKAAVMTAFEFDDSILVEKWLAGAEYSVPILGDKVLAPIHIIPEGEFYDYHAKYVSDKTQFICPADLSPEREKELKELVLAAFKSVGGKGWGRVDVLCDDKGKFHLVEINTTPGMTDHSLFPCSAKSLGINFADLVVNILAKALI